MDLYWTQAFVFSVEGATSIVGGSVKSVEICNGMSSNEDDSCSLELTVFRTDDGDNKGYAAYEIKEGDDYIAYGDVNDGGRIGGEDCCRRIRVVLK